MKIVVLTLTMLLYLYRYAIDSQIEQKESEWKKSLKKSIKQDLSLLKEKPTTLEQKRMVMELIQKKRLERPLGLKQKIERNRENKKKRRSELLKYIKAEKARLRKGGLKKGYL